VQKPRRCSHQESSNALVPSGAEGELLGGRARQWRNFRRRLLADLYGSADYHANLIKVIAQRGWQFE